MRKISEIIVVLMVLFVLPVLSGCGISGIIHDVGNSGFIYKNADKYTKGEADISSEVEDIEIDWIAGGVDIVYHDGDKILIRETAKRELNDSQQLRWYLDGMTLRIKYAKSGFHTNTFKNFDGKKLTLSLPKGMRIGELEVNLASADLKTDGIDIGKTKVNSASGDLDMVLGTAKEFDIDTASGNVVIKTDSADDLDIDSASGDVKLDILHIDDLSVDVASGKIYVNSDDVNDADLESASGDMYLTIKERIKRADIDTVSGDIELNLPETKGYTLKHKTVSGEMENEFAVTKSGSKYTYNDGSFMLDVETISGNLNIKKADLN